MGRGGRKGKSGRDGRRNEERKGSGRLRGKGDTEEWGEEGNKGEKWGNKQAIYTCSIISCQASMYPQVPRGENPPGLTMYGLRPSALQHKISHQQHHQETSTWKQLIQPTILERCPQ